MPRYITPFLLAAALCATPTHADRIPLEPGPDTTVYEGPLRDDGTVDYIVALNAEMSLGVTPENNVFVELWLARPTARYDEIDDRVAELLGLDEVIGGPLFLGFFDFMEEPGRAVPEDELWKIYNASLDGPFVGDDLPDVMAWLERNEAALDRIVAAVDRPRFFAPCLGNANDDSFSGAAFPYLSMHREYARAIQVRIHYAIGEGHAEDVADDLLALRRLGAHLRTGPTMISLLVGYSIDAMSHYLLLTALNENALDAAEIERLAAGWSPRVGQLTIAQTLENGERLATLDLLQRGWAGHLGLEDQAMAEVLFGEEYAALLTGAFTLVLDDRFDINAAMIQINKQYDEYSEAFRAETYAGFVEAASAYEESLENALGMDEETLLLAAAEGKIPQDASGSEMTRAFTYCIAELLMPALASARKTEYLTHMRTDLAGVGFALERFKLDDGTYPDTLGELVPGYLDALPGDVFNGGQPLRYLPDNDRLGYTAYSVGRDQEDDGGLDEPNGDIVFRVGPE